MIAAYGDAPEFYSDAGFHRFAALRMGIHSIRSKVSWCNETLAAIDHRLTSMRRARTSAGSKPDNREEFQS